MNTGMLKRGTGQSSHLPLTGPGQFRPCLGLQIGQGHPRLRGEARPSRQNPFPLSHLLLA